MRLLILLRRLCGVFRKYGLGGGLLRLRRHLRTSVLQALGLPALLQKKALRRLLRSELAGKARVIQRTPVLLQRGSGCFLPQDIAAFGAGAPFRLEFGAADERVHRFGHIRIDDHLIAPDDLHQDIKCRRRAAFKNHLLRPAAAGFLIGKGHGLDAADQVRKRGVHQQVGECASVGRSDQLDSALGDGPGCPCFKLAADLIDNDDFRIVVLNSLDHHFMLKIGPADLQAAGIAHGRVRNITVAADPIAKTQGVSGRSSTSP